MGYSGWYHVDFKRIVAYDSRNRMFHVEGEDGNMYYMPRRFVADAGDYHAGDKNGVISVKETYAVHAGWIDGQS